LTSVRAWIAGIRAQPRSDPWGIAGAITDFTILPNAALHQRAAQIRSTPTRHVSHLVATAYQFGDAGLRRTCKGCAVTSSGSLGDRCGHRRRRLDLGATDISHEICHGCQRVYADSTISRRCAAAPTATSPVASGVATGRNAARRDRGDVLERRARHICGRHGCERRADAARSGCVADAMSQLAPILHA